MVERPDDVSDLPDLEPLEDDGEPEGGDFSDLLRSFDDGADLDDSVSHELDAGIDLADADSEAEEQEGPELSIDVGEIVGAGADSAAPAELDDELGPTEEIVRNDAPEPEEVASDDGEGTFDADDPLPEDLPQLDVDPDLELEGTPSESEDLLEGTEEADEEDRPAAAELPWVAVPIAFPGGPVRALVVAGERLVAAGEDVVRIGENDVIETLAVRVGPAASIVADSDSRVVLVATESGELLRVAAGEPADHLSSWHMAVPGSRTARPSLRLAGPTPSGRPAILLHVQGTGGALLESTDRGTTWRRVDLGKPVVAVSSGSPPICVVEAGGESLRLLRSAPSGGFDAVGRDWSSDAEHLEISAAGDALAILEQSKGVRVSADAGATLQRARGTRPATAVTTGRLGGRSSAFTALFDPNSGRSTLVWIDPVSAEARSIAEVLPEDRDDEDDDWARVSALAWDASTESLWAAGKFGLRRWRRPST